VNVKRKSAFPVEINIIPSNPVKLSSTVFMRNMQKKNMSKVAHNVNQGLKKMEAVII